MLRAGLTPRKEIEKDNLVQKRGLNLIKQNKNNLGHKHGLNLIKRNKNNLEHKHGLNLKNGVKTI